MHVLYLQGLLHDIEKKDSDPSLRAALNNLLHLALDGDHMCYLISSVCIALIC